MFCMQELKIFLSSNSSNLSLMSFRASSLCKPELLYLLKHVDNFAGDVNLVEVARRMQDQQLLLYNLVFSLKAFRVCLR